jgi:hypothetical protein
MSLNAIDRRYQDPPCECGDLFCSGCDWDTDDADFDDDMDKFGDWRDDVVEEYDDGFEYNDEAEPYRDDERDAPLPQLNPGNIYEDEIPF